MLNAILIIIGAYVASLVVFGLLRLLARAASKTRTSLDDRIIIAFGKPIQSVKATFTMTTFSSKGN